MPLADFSGAHSPSKAALARLGVGTGQDRINSPCTVNPRLAYKQPRAETVVTAKHSGDSSVALNSPATLEISRDFTIASGAEPAVITKAPTSEMTTRKGLCRSQVIRHPLAYQDNYVCSEVPCTGGGGVDSLYLYCIKFCTGLESEWRLHSPNSLLDGLLVLANKNSAYNPMAVLLIVSFYAVYKQNTKNSSCTFGISYFLKLVGFHKYKLAQAEPVFQFWFKL